jgi:hypothetical protein
VRQWLIDEKILYHTTIAGLKAIGDNIMCGIVQQRWNDVERTHRVVWHWLLKTQRIPAFTGNVHHARALTPETGNAQLIEAFSLSNELVIENPSDKDGEDDNGDLMHIENDDLGDGGHLSGRVDNPDHLGSLVDTLGIMAL